MINVLLVDDHEMVRLGVSSYLSMQDDIEVMDEAKNGREGVEKALSLKPDIILMDLVMCCISCFIMAAPRTFVSSEA